ALELAQSDREARNAHVAALRDRLIEGTLHAVPGAFLTGHPSHRLPNLASFCFEEVNGESLMLALDHHGMMASTGSACTSGSLEPSHVLLALGLDPSLAAGSLRLSLSRGNTNAEVDRLLALLPDLIRRLREIG